MKGGFEKNFIFERFYWQFFEMPKKILIGWKNILLFNLNYFSIFLLLKTLFSPWHRYQWRFPRGFDPGKYISVLFSNLISSIIGAIIRLTVIVFGLLIEVFIFFLGAVFFLFWLFLPFICLFGFLFSLKYVLF